METKTNNNKAEDGSTNTLINWPETLPKPGGTYMDQRLTCNNNRNDILRNITKEALINEFSKVQLEVFNQNPSVDPIDLQWWSEADTDFPCVQELQIDLHDEKSNKSGVEIVSNLLSSSLNDQIELLSDGLTKLGL